MVGLTTIIERIPVKESGSRIRLSSTILGRLDWGTYGQPFECFGIFRLPNELICAPKALTTENGAHPFDDALHLIENTALSTPSSLKNIPAARVITASYRVIGFEASWPSRSGKQLDLKLGTAITARLGWQQGQGTYIYAAAWNRILLIMSETRFNETQREDFTDGNLNI